MIWKSSDSSSCHLQRYHTIIFWKQQSLKLCYCYLIFLKLLDISRCCNWLKVKTNGDSLVLYILKAFVLQLNTYYIFNIWHYSVNAQEWYYYLSLGFYCSDEIPWPKATWEGMDSFILYLVLHQVGNSRQELTQGTMEQHCLLVCPAP